MKITFLIGNGFDLNLGLDTTYNSFLKHYLKDTANDSDVIKEFKSKIQQDLDCWACAELAFGKITSHFQNTSEEVQNFSNCHIDFCEHLAEYFRFQEKRIDYKKNKDLIEKAFCTSLSKCDLGLREEQRNNLKNLVTSQGSNIEFNFINFNYTNTLDNFVKLIDNTESMKLITFQKMSFYNTIGKIYHVHGTTEKDMVFGVNDESQITNLKLFEGQQEVFKNQLIKRETNKMYEERIDEKVFDVLKNSHLIYIFGMSIGKTDADWWNNISRLLAKNFTLHVIIQAMDVPKNELIRVKFVQFENSIRSRFVNFLGLGNEAKDSIKTRIHVVGENIFDGFTQFVSKQENYQEHNNSNPNNKESA
ncbi:MAG: hypothetical protein HDR33_04460 [Treponema sp.]|nr:hypothetical protein [Treponema sp.]